MKERLRFRVWNGKEILYKGGLGYDGNQLIEDKGHIIMQCTGLKDKNGKLIFEGDIIKYTDCEGKKTIGSLVIDRFNLLTFTNMITCTFCEDWSEVVKAVFFTGSSTIEVIGNIYENKELLGEQK